MELRPEPTTDERYRILSAWADGVHVATVALGLGKGWRVAVTPGPERFGRREMTDVLGAIADLATKEGRDDVILGSTDLLLRHQAREFGFRGPLRQHLRFDLNAPPVATTTGAMPDRFVADLQSLLPDLAISARRPAGLLRSMLRSASSGVAGSIYLSALASDGLEPLPVGVALGPGMMAEPVALGIDTAMSVRRRFHPLVDRVRIFYDQSQRGFTTGQWAGVAQSGVAGIHLNSCYALADELDTLAERRQQLSPKRFSLQVSPPFTRIDGIVAHEYWHQIETGFKSKRYKDSIQFRLALGRHFGVETIEHAVRGNSPDAPAAWQAAHQRLESEVSTYATTNANEATAEMFELWWCTTGEPTPIAKCFDTLIQQYLPAP